MTVSGDDVPLLLLLVSRGVGCGDSGGRLRDRGEAFDLLPILVAAVFLVPVDAVAVAVEAAAVAVAAAEAAEAAVAVAAAIAERIVSRQFAFVDERRSCS
jgi:hypothetical protein